MSVSVLTTVYFGRMVEEIEMPFGVVGLWVGTCTIDGVQISLGNGQILEKWGGAI